MLKASLAKGYRNPSFREMYLYAVANPDLAPESMMNYEPTVGKHFFAHLDNITDAKYMINNGYEMPGFNVMGGIKIIGVR